MSPKIRQLLDSLRGKGITNIGLPWYAAADWQQVRQVMKDGHSLASTYGQWEADAKEVEDALRGEGYTVIRAHIRPVEFVQWCKAGGHHVNAQGRNAFANYCAMKGDGQVH